MRRGITLICVVIAVAALYQFAFGADRVTPRVRLPIPAATIGSGPEVVVVASDGTILPWFPPPEEGSLPELPLSEVPDGGRLAGPALAQARVLGAAPAALRPFVASSSYGESGVDLLLRSGIELRFGDATRLEEKWRAAAAVLAVPETEALDYVDLHAPRRPATGGSGHTLPPIP